MSEATKNSPSPSPTTIGGPLRTVKPFTPEVRATIDHELVDKAIAFMRRQQTAGTPFFLYLPFSMGHAPNLPSAPFKGKSRIGNYGDKMMEVTVDFRMVKTSSGARLTHAIDITPKTFVAKLFSPFIRRQLPKQTIGAMERLRALLERRS